MEYMDSSNGELSDGENDEDGDGQKKKKLLKLTKRKNLLFRQHRQQADDEPLEDSDDGDGEGRELDYISSSDGDRYILEPITEFI